MNMMKRLWRGANEQQWETQIARYWGWREVKQNGDAELRMDQVNDRMLASYTVEQFYDVLANHTTGIIGGSLGQ